MFAYDYPVLGFFWSVFIFFIWVLWFILLFQVFIDIFRSHDLGGWGKALWVIFVIIVPYLGVFIYLIARGHKMQEHAMESAKAHDAAMRAYVQDAAGSGGAASELERLAALKANGTITDAEFQQMKAKVLG